MFIMTALLWFCGDGLITVTVSNNDFINEILAVIAVYTLLFLFVNIKELAKKRTESTDNIS